MDPLIRLWLDHLSEPAGYLVKGGATMVPLAVVSVWMWALIYRAFRGIGPLSGGDDAPPGPAAAALHGGRRRIACGVRTILVLASIAPLLGLLGTVTGMIETFDVISRFGTGNHRAMSAGISEALITTQAGLLIAVPGLVLGQLLKRRLERLNVRAGRLGPCSTGKRPVVPPATRKQGELQP